MKTTLYCRPRQLKKCEFFFCASIKLTLLCTVCVDTSILHCYTSLNSKKTLFTYQYHSDVTCALSSESEIKQKNVI